MTPEVLQNELAEELGKIFADVELYDASDKRAKMHIFHQTLPRKEGEEDPEPFPWCLVKFGENEVKGVGGLVNQVQQIVLYFGIYYDKTDCQYQHTMFTLFEKVKKRFLTNPMLGAFSALPDMVSVMDDDEEATYPYYFGGMSLRFLLPTYEREDEYC